MRLLPIEVRFFFVGLGSSAETLEAIDADIEAIEQDLVKMLSTLKVRLAHSRVLSYHSAIACDDSGKRGTMAQILIRNLDDELVGRLKKRAKGHGRSLQAEAKRILEEAAPDYEAVWRRIDRFRNKLKRSGRTFSDSAELIREDRDR